MEFHFRLKISCANVHHVEVLASRNVSSRLGSDLLPDKPAFCVQSNFYMGNYLNIGFSSAVWNGLVIPGTLCHRNIPGIDRVRNCKQHPSVCQQPTCSAVLSVSFPSTFVPIPLEQILQIEQFLSSICNISVLSKQQNTGGGGAELVDEEGSLMAESLARNIFTHCTEF